MTYTSMDPELADYERQLTAGLNGATATEVAPVAMAVRTLVEMADDPALSRPPDWVVRPFFERGSLSAIYGQGKIGKSTMLASMAVHVSTGREWAGYDVASGPILWIDLEQGPRRLVRNFKAITGWHDADIRVCSDLGAVPALSTIRQAIATHAPALVVIDSLSKWAEGQPLPPKDENDNAGWSRVLKPLEAVARDCTAAVVVIDHDRKGEGEHGRAMRGASSKLAAFDCAIHVKRGSGTVRKLEAVSREVGDFTAAVERTEAGYRQLVAIPQTCRVLEALKALNESVTVKTLHDYLKRQGYDVSQRTVRTRLEAAVTDGKATVNGAGTKNDPALYTAIRGTDA